jgi:hypothetical protein
MAGRIFLKSWSKGSSIFAGARHARTHLTQRRTRICGTDGHRGSRSCEGECSCVQHFFEETAEYCGTWAATVVRLIKESSHNFMQSGTARRRPKFAPVNNGRSFSSIPVSKGVRAYVRDAFYPVSLPVPNLTGHRSDARSTTSSASSVPVLAVACNINMSPDEYEQPELSEW